ncbi:MAG: hypothetical protein HY461_01590 [Parcubacteria group bacterium]|nr:hypothetical protein [Parcubacteria group bacterium]
MTTWYILVGGWEVEYSQDGRLTGWSRPFGRRRSRSNKDELHAAFASKIYRHRNRVGRNARGQRRIRYDNDPPGSA